MRLTFTCYECRAQGDFISSPRAWAATEVSITCPECGTRITQRDDALSVAYYGIPLAAGVLIVNEHTGAVLGVSRRDDRTAFGIPCGKVDLDDGPTTPSFRGETLRRAAARELFEETGLEVDPDDLKFVFSTLDGHGSWTFVLTPTSPIRGEPHRGTDEGDVRWVSWATLEAGPFGEFNRELRQVFETSADL